MTRSETGLRLPGTEKPVPVLDLQRQYLSTREEILAAIERVCASQQFVLGPEVEALEREIAAFVGAKEAVACASGTDALWLALVAAGIGSGDKVITTPFSFFASASSIVRSGAEPVFVDVDPETLNLDAEKVRGAITRRGGRPRPPTPDGASGATRTTRTRGASRPFFLSISTASARTGTHSRKLRMNLGYR